MQGETLALDDDEPNSNGSHNHQSGVHISGGAVHHSAGADAAQSPEDTAHHRSDSGRCGGRAFWHSSARPRQQFQHLWAGGNSVSYVSCRSGNRYVALEEESAERTDFHSHPVPFNTVLSPERHRMVAARCGCAFRRHFPSFYLEDFAAAKEYVKAGIVAIETEQDTGIVYYIGQEISKTNTTIEEYLKIIESITREDLIEIANSIEINTIYFLRN